MLQNTYKIKFTICTILSVLLSGTIIFKLPYNKFPEVIISQMEHNEESIPFLPFPEKLLESSVLLSVSEYSFLQIALNVCNFLWSNNCSPINNCILQVLLKNSQSKFFPLNKSSSSSASVPRFHVLSSFSRLLLSQLTDGGSSSWSIYVLLLLLDSQTHNEAQLLTGAARSFPGHPDLNKNIETVLFKTQASC